VSVKSKVKRCNKRIAELEQEVEKLNRELNSENTIKSSLEQLYENIIKFAITNHVGGLKAGVMISCEGVDKMKELRLDIERNMFENSYIVRVIY
jgi:archaellum component FlaC